MSTLSSHLFKKLTNSCLPSLNNLLMFSAFKASTSVMTYLETLSLDSIMSSLILLMCLNSSNGSCHVVVTVSGTQMPTWPCKIRKNLSPASPTTHILWPCSNHSRFSTLYRLYISCFDFYSFSNLITVLLSIRKSWSVWRSSADLKSNGFLRMPSIICTEVSHWKDLHIRFAHSHSCSSSSSSPLSEQAAHAAL